MDGFAFSELADAERMAEEIMDGRETSSRAIGGARDPGKGNHNAKLGLMKSPTWQIGPSMRTRSCARRWR